MRKKLVAGVVGSLALTGCQRNDQSAAPANTQEPAPVAPGMPASAPAAAATRAPSLGQATDSKSELRMEVTEANRAGGVLTVKTRFTLIAGKPGVRPLPGGSTADVYLTAADKKYLLLKDDHDKELMSSGGFPDFAQIGSTQTWWGKFPAPGPDVKAVDLYFTGFEPVENVALTDR